MAESVGTGQPDAGCAWRCPSPAFAVPSFAAKEVDMPQPEAHSAAMFLPHCERVRADWVDYNGHMNVAYYVLIFDHATDAVLDVLDLGASYRARSGCSVFVGEMHVRYRRELLEADEVTVASRLATADERRLVLLHEMTCERAGGIAAVNEVLCVHVDLGTRRGAAWPDGVAARLRDLAAGEPRRPGPPAP
jgi:acyl-CoA thioester hydrolase